MIDILGQILWYSGLVIPECIVVAILLSFKSLSYGKRTIVAFSFGIAIFTFLIQTSLGIVLRDGLGPGGPSISSEGLEGISKSFSGLLIGSVVAFVMALPGYYVIGRNRQSKTNRDMS